MSYLSNHGISKDQQQKFGIIEDTDKVTFPYKDKEGNFLFNKYRHLDQRSLENGKKFSFSSGYKPVLFNIQALDQDYVVYAEGEPDVVRSDQEGIPTVSGSTGAATFNKDWVPDFIGKRVYICLDNDDTGREGARKVAELLLRGSVEEVYQLTLPEDCKDICEFYSKGHTKEEFLNLLENAQRAKLEDFKDTQNQDDSLEDESGDKEENESITKQVIKLVLESGAKLFHDQFNDSYLAPTGNGQLVFRLKSKQAKSWLSYLTWKYIGLSLSSHPLNSTILTLEAMACYEGPQISLAIRVAKEGEIIWYDLGGKTIKITSEGWDIVEESPILFRRFPHQKYQIEPKSGNKLDELLDFINLERQADGRLSDEQLLTLCWLVFGLVPGLPHPALVLYGSQGSKKTTLHKILKELLDPSSIEVNGSQKNITEFVQTVSHHWFLVLDNMTYLPEWLSDAMCRVISGGGLSKRELHSDDDDILYNFRHIVGINGINLMIEKADLYERSLIFVLKRIKKFKTEKLFWAQFEERKPYILGALFDTLVKTLQIISTTPEPEGEFRMADFAHWGPTIAQALGYEANDFLKAYKANIYKQNKEALEASPVGLAVIDLMSDQDRWSGTPTELLSELDKIALKLRIDQDHKSWPKDARWVWRRISEVLPNLEEEGIKASKGKDDARLIILEKTLTNDVGNDNDGGQIPNNQVQSDIKDNKGDIFGGGVD
ncbi:MAG: Uncharacterized protein G01um10147_239 [Microgenomates group bacterium Gr01-1014_7]|nr:MAG: Uncharacterized protein G01um10147_239 [Microgenomates group bacterium Gr01-1014_7]